MFSVTLASGSLASSLGFRTEEAATKAFDLAMASFAAEGPTFIGDDFGQKLILGPGALAFATLENHAISKELRIEMALHQARTQKGAQQRAETDPTLRSGVMGAGPAMLQPMMNGGRPF